MPYLSCCSGDSFVGDCFLGDSSSDDSSSDDSFSGDYSSGFVYFTYAAAVLTGGNDSDTSGRGALSTFISSATRALEHDLESHSDSVPSVAFSKDGQLLASGSYDRTIRLWDPAAGALQHTISTDGTIVNLEFSKHSPQLITNLGTFNIQVCDKSFFPDPSG
jgi:WD40 repeat protein